MDMFSPSTLEAEGRFKAPRFRTFHHIEVLFPNGYVEFWDGTDLTPNRDEALEYTDIEEAADDYERLSNEGLNASIETFQRIAR